MKRKNKRKMLSLSPRLPIYTSETYKRSQTLHYSFSSLKFNINTEIRAFPLKTRQAQQIESDSMTKRLFAMLECQSRLENLSPFVDTKRHKRFSSTTTTTCSSSSSSNAIIGFPELTKEPETGSDRTVLCRLCVRLPDGRRVQRSFLKSESVQLLWSFCNSQIDESERKKGFKLIQAVPGEYKTLYYGSDTTFDQSGLANSLISVTWI